MKNKNIKYILVLFIVLGVLVAGCTGPKQTAPETPTQQAPAGAKPTETTAPLISTDNDKMTDQNSQKMIQEGRETFRHDTFWR